MRCKPVCCTRVRKVCSSLRFLGDRVVYGAQPAEVLDCIMAVQAEGAQALGANHVQFTLVPLSAVQHMGDIGARWTHSQHNAQQRNWLAPLPLSHDLGAVLLVHASANEPERWSSAPSLGERGFSAVRRPKCFPARRE